MAATKTSMIAKWAVRVLLECFLVIAIMIVGGLWFFWNRNGNDDRKKLVENSFFKYSYSTIQEYTVAIATVNQLIAGVIEHNASYGTILKLFIRTKISSQT